MMAAGGAHYDISRFGMEVFRASPRQADIMIVAGRVSQKMAPVLRQVYDQMMEPKWVISMGVCASTGGMFNNYALVQGVDQIVPVDVYAPGCPPTPETLLHAIETLHQQIEDGELMRRRAEGAAPTSTWGRSPPGQPVPVLLGDRMSAGAGDDRHAWTAPRYGEPSGQDGRPSVTRGRTSTRSRRSPTTATRCASTSPPSTTSPTPAAPCRRA